MNGMWIESQNGNIERHLKVFINPNRPKEIYGDSPTNGCVLLGEYKCEADAQKTLNGVLKIMAGVTNNTYVHKMPCCDDWAFLKPSEKTFDLW